MVPFINQNRQVLWLLPALLIIFFPSFTSTLKINKYGGYEDVVVRIENEVPPIICQQLLQNIREIFTAASDYLLEATERQAYYHRIIVIVPSTWDSRACGGQFSAHSASTSLAAEAAVEIRSDHPIFGSFPFTQQSQGCGKPGDRITVGYRFFLSNNDSVEGGSVSYPHRRLVHEWAKYRYGVFEEGGFANDSVYPLGYRRESNSDVEPNLCTNGKLSGSWSEHCASSGSSNCAFSISVDSAENITSSLMSVPMLPSVKSFCDSSNHNHLAPSKHNFLCNGKSVSEVVMSHPDFKDAPSSRQARRVSPEILVKQVVAPRYVLLIEETANMNLRDVWKYLKLAVRKFIKYDLEVGTQVGIVTMGTDNVRVLANMTTLEDKVRETIAQKLPNYPNIESSGSLSLRRGISQAINMLKWNGGRVAGSVIVLISQGIIPKHDLDGIVQLLKQEEVSVATIEYPSSGDGKVATLSYETKGPYYAVRETGVGTLSHMSTYIQLINALSDIQRHFALPSSTKTPILIHQEEFSGDAPSFVESSFSFDGSHSVGQFYIYVPNPNDPKVNTVELMSPTGKRYTDQLSLDINVIKIDARIDQPGTWHYRIQRLGDSHQSHFVQVVATAAASSMEELSVRVFSSADGESRRLSDFTKEPLILYAEVKKGAWPVIDAEVEASLVVGSTKWFTKLLDNGNGDPDLTRNDGVYSRYILPPSTIRSDTLEISVKVTTNPHKSKFIGWDSSMNGMKTHDDQPCCGSSLLPTDSPSLKTMSHNERLITSYVVRITNVGASHQYPPSRVGDLAVVGSLERNVTFQFTCPGDDFDQGKVHSFDFYFSKTRDGMPYEMEKVHASDTYLAGTVVQLNFTFRSWGVFYIKMQSTDPYGLSSPYSNVAEVMLARSSGDGAGNSGLLSQESSNVKASVGFKLSKSEIAFTVVGVLAFFILVIGLIIMCICCRRRSQPRKEVPEDRGVFAITEVKGPTHWSASELLQEHEKRQSMYGQTTTPGPTDNQGPPVNSQHQNLQQQGGGGVRYYSPTSSTRSYRSFADGQYRASLDGGRRPTFTDYESCSSDPIIKGHTDYDTAADSDAENVHYRTIDSYVGAMYRANMNANVNPAFSETSGPVGVGRAVGIYEETGTQSKTQVQYNYNSNFQGSTTSVNSKRRNITMV